MPIEHFKTNVLLKSIIGKDLINDDNIAVLELVKNAFDAGSKKVDILFKNIKQNDDGASKKKNEPDYTETSSKIIIQDWGGGMDKGDLIGRWLNIAYSDKKQRKEEHGRILAGAKGIGRFSCDRLGRFLDIYTKKSGSPMMHLHLDWRDFEIENQPNRRIESIPVHVDTLQEKDLARLKLKPFKSGTRIEISKLRSGWDEDKLKGLRRYLERLINPNQTFSQTEFLLNLEAKEFEEDISGPIKNQIFGRLDFTSTSIESVISEDGSHITTTLRDKGQTIFELVEHNKSFPLLKDVRIVIYYLNPYSKGYFKRLTGLDKVAFGSIFLFINGFRIPPYGEERDDWLGLDRHKAQGYARNLGTREVVGRIEINDQSGAYKIVSSREGIATDDRTEELTDRSEGFYYLTHKRLEKYVTEGLDWDKAPKDHAAMIAEKALEKNWKFNPADEIYTQDERKKSLRILETLNSALATKPDNVVRLFINSELIETLAKEEHQKAGEIFARFNSFRPSFTKATSAAMLHVQRVFARQERKLKKAEAAQTKLAEEAEALGKKVELVTKQNLFLSEAVSTDSKEILALQHHIGICASSIETNVGKLIKAINEGKSTDVLRQFVMRISFENAKIRSVTRSLPKAQFAAIDEKIDEDLIEFIKQYVENVHRLYESDDVNNSKLDVSVIAPANLKWPASFSHTEIIMLIDNLLDNSQKAGSSRVDINFIQENDSLEIHVTDFGNGIAKENLPHIFEFGFSTTQGGSGVGLYHAERIVRRLGGKISTNPKRDVGAEFIIQLKK